ncbi:MAG: hypothetical protein HY716_03855 [Planctomycetes bacterium]|nr:hypothetical protein [Planctomycetota bacterium]
MTIGTGTGRNGIHHYYRCTRLWDGSERCSVRMVPARELDLHVVDRLRELNRRPELVRAMVGAANLEAVEATRRLEAERGETLRQLSLVDDRLRKILDFIGEGRRTETIREELLSLEDRKKLLKERLEGVGWNLREIHVRTVAENSFGEALASFESYWKKAKEEEAAELIEMRVALVIYKPEEIRIGYYSRLSATGGSPTLHAGSLSPRGRMLALSERCAASRVEVDLKGFEPSTS